MKPRISEQTSEQAVLSCLAEVPFVRVTRTQLRPEVDSEGPDLVAELQLPGDQKVLMVEVKSSGQPRLIREAANQLLRWRERFPGAYGVVVAPYISPAAVEICAREGIGYVDLAGNCRLSFDQVYIRREGNPNRFARRRDLRSLYSPKAERVLRVLLENPGRAWKLLALAAEADVSLGQASNVKKLLADREWIRAEPQGLVLIEPLKLLTEWAERYTPRRSHAHDYYSLKNVGDVEYDLAGACEAKGIRCALTGFSGAVRLAPAVRYQRVNAYVEGDTNTIAEMLGLKPVASGANVTLLVPYDAGVFYSAKPFDRIPVVSPVQVYLDLQGVRGRGEEAATAILEEVIRPRWQQPVSTTPPTPSPRPDQSC